MSWSNNLQSYMNENDVANSYTYACLYSASGANFGEAISTEKGNVEKKALTVSTRSWS